MPDQGFLFEDPPDPTHWVYFAVCLTRGHEHEGQLKIGHAKDPRQRMRWKDLRDSALAGRQPCSCPDLFDDKDRCHCELEERHHRALAPARLPSSEWFDLRSRQAQYFVLWQFPGDQLVAFLVRKAAGARRDTA